MHKRFFNFSSDGSVGNIDIFGSIGEDWWADDGGNTALHLAAQFGHADIAADALEAGADPGRTNRNRKTALDYSFVLGIPSIMAAAVLTLKDASEAGEVIDWGPMLAGMITACIVGFLAIKLLRFMVTTNKLHVFAWYTLILGVICVIIGIIEKATGASLFSGAAIV